MQSHWLFSRSKDFRVIMGGGPENASHDMYAEFQPQAMDIICQRPEALPMLSGHIGAGRGPL